LADVGLLPLELDLLKFKKAVYLVKDGVKFRKDTLNEKEQLLMLAAFLISRTLVQKIFFKPYRLIQMLGLIGYHVDP
jgi:hypothetical protein